MSNRALHLLVVMIAALVTCVVCVQAQTSADNERLKQYLERFPNADADQDGVLTLREAQEHRRQQGRQGGRPDGRVPRPFRPAPDVADFAYGDHELQRFDLWLAESDEPTALILFIHGGGFRGGDKVGISPDRLQEALKARISYASLNYRLTPEVTSPTPFFDCARALQTIRHHADEWNLDPERIAATGGSAGAGISLWLAFHDDLADPASEDPIARQSTRLVCAAVTNGQCSYDPSFCESIGIPRLMEHPFFFQFYGIEPGQQESEEAKRLYAEAAPITYLTEDDPPVMMEFSFPNEPITDQTPMGAVVHHPLFGIALKQRMDELGIRCEVRYRDQEGVEPLSVLGFVKGYVLANDGTK